MVFYLGAVCKKLRKAEGFKESRIAGDLDASDDTVRNFENGRQWPTKYGVDEVLDAYVKRCAVDSRWEIWQMAIDAHKAATAPGVGESLREKPLRPGSRQPKRRRAP